MLLIPENILENLTCDNCKKYLSVSPVKVYPNKHIHCGRCSEENDGGVKSLYFHIMERSLFKCINRYDGCNKVLPHSKVSSHEEYCKSELYSCPNCPLVPKMSSLLIINHFKEHHKENILKSCFIVINPDILNIEDKKYLYIKENFIFVICVSFKNNYLVLNTFHIGKPESSRGITQRFILSYSSDGLLKRYITEKIPICIYDNIQFHDGFLIHLETQKCSLNIEIDLDTIKAQKLIFLPLSHNSRIDNISEHCTLMDPVDIYCNKLHLSKEFEKTWFPQYTLHVSESALVNVNAKLISNCCFCENKFHFFSINQSIYKCTQCPDCNRFICSKCYFFGITKCDNGKNYEFAPQETTVFKGVQYFCKWNCGETIFSWDLQKHEYNCAFRKNFFCSVENCKWLGALSVMPEHVESHEGITFYKGHSFRLNLIVTKEFYCKKEVVIPVLNQFVNLKWKKVNNKYIFSLCIKRSNKIPVAVVTVNENTDIFIDSFVLDIRDNPWLLIILRDN